MRWGSKRTLSGGSIQASAARMSAATSAVGFSLRACAPAHRSARAFGSATSSGPRLRLWKSASRSTSFPCRRRRHHLQLRRLFEAQDADRRWRVRRHQFLAGGPGEDRQGGPYRGSGSVITKDVPDDAMAWSAARRITAMVGRSVWLLGAGASQSAGLPTATDIIWDLKRRFYCSEEQQAISANDLQNNARVVLQFLGVMPQDWKARW